ncbi:hypothetical protein SAMN05421825_3755 [Epilithonimonas hungarica]|uniref:Uncharacterized protein n=1 Tax=Epilithonimonas hungarica TaxID=454006 RepID=A0A1G7VY69_9FLAO|nr:hypothetical protein [Epilithonimonas hungarica]SDG64725.1 hypothetical protein SAMN05421825_3755 [Epilithonimonas hungarica]
MFNLFTKKFWCHFYLSSELYYLVKDINPDTISIFFKNENITFSRLKIYNISNKLIYISIAFEEEKSISQFKNYISKFKEPFPPNYFLFSYCITFISVFYSNCF